MGKMNPDTRSKIAVNYQIQQTDLALLWKAGVGADDMRHSVWVAAKALEIARRTGREMDFELVGRGALLHDLGKALTHSFQHGELGAEIGRKPGLPPAITGLMEKHFHGGLSLEEARELGLPEMDYTPRRLEERIVMYADRLVDIITEGLVALEDEQDAERDFEEILRGHTHYGKNQPTLERYLRYHREIQALIAKNKEDEIMGCSNSCPISRTETMILATDGSRYSEGAVREAIRIAGPCSSKIIAVMAFESNPEYDTIGSTAYDAQVAEAQTYLAAIKEQADKAGVSCETVLHTDSSPAAAVVAEATARNADMIVIGRRGWKGIAKALVGEVAAAVIGRAGCKVLVVPRAARIEYKHILAAVDGSKHSDAALHEAIAIAKRCGSTLLLLSAMRDESERTEAESLVRRAAEIAKQEGVQTEGVTPPGRSFNAIVETAGGRSVDLIVMGTYGKSGIKKAILGSSTEKVIANAGCAVLVVKAGS